MPFNISCKFRGTLATRHKPTGEGLRTQILKRQNFLSKDNSPVPESSPVKPELKPDKKSKDAKTFLMADLQKLQKKVCKESSPEVAKCEPEGDTNNNNMLDSSCHENDSQKVNNPFLAELGSNKGSKLKKAIKPKMSEVPSIQDQLQLKLAARKKLVDEADELAEN